MVIPIIFPVYWLVVSALQSPSDRNQASAFLPSANILPVFCEEGIYGIWNCPFPVEQYFITVVSTILTLAVACLAAFSNQAYEYRMKEDIQQNGIICIYVSADLNYHTYIICMMSKMGLINTYKGLILCYNCI